MKKYLHEISIERSKKDDKKIITKVTNIHEQRRLPHQKTCGIYVRQKEKMLNDTLMCRKQRKIHNSIRFNVMEIIWKEYHITRKMEKAEEKGQ